MYNEKYLSARFWDWFFFWVKNILLCHSLLSIDIDYFAKCYVRLKYPNVIQLKSGECTKYVHFDKNFNLDYE